MPLHRDPQERLDSIERKLDSESIDPDLRVEIEEKLPDIYREFISLQSEKGFEQHMAKFVSEAYRKRQQGERGPLCTCSLATCPLTNGEIPAKVRYSASSIFGQEDGRKRVLEYVQGHSGAEVLHEMIDAWDQREGQLHRDIAKTHSQLVKEHDKKLGEVSYNE